MTASGDTVFRNDSDSGEEFGDDDSIDSWASFDGNGESSDDQDDRSTVADDGGDSSSDRESIPRGNATHRNRVRRGRGHGDATTTTTNFDWQPYDYRDAYSNEWLGDFNKRPGSLVDTTGFTPPDFFSLLFPDTAINLLVEQTNAYAAFTLATVDDTYYKQRWMPTTPEEMRAFIGLQIAMGQNKRPSLDDYWTQFWLLGTEFAAVMSRQRYKMLSAFFHFSDPAQRIRRGEEGYEALGKIQPLLDITQGLYADNYYPNRQLCIDESMARFKGRCHFRQYMPDKPTKRGFKCFSVCDSKSLYCLKFLIYTGKQDFHIPEGKTFTQHLVTALMSDYLNNNHILYCDNFYTSPTLFLDLQQQNTGAVGTVVENRTGYPRDLKKKNLRLKKGDDPVFSRSGDLVCVAWHDTKRCSFLSTVHTDNTINKRIRSKGAPGGFRTIEKPVIADNYSTYMGGVDHFDQLMKNYAYPHRSYKWYMALYHYIKETALVNAHILFKEANNKDSVKDFRTNIIDAFVRPHMMTRKALKMRPNNVVPRLAAAHTNHFPMKFEDKSHRPVCKVCSEIKKRAQTRFYCPACNVALCIDNCFRLYHTADNIKRARAALDA